MKFPTIQKCLKKIGYRLHPIGLIRASTEDVPEFIRKLEGYIEEYTREDNKAGIDCLRKVLTAINENDWELAFKLFKEGYENLGGLPQSWQYLRNKANDQKLEKQGLAHWCETPGKYIAYRAGSIAKSSRGIYFASSYQDAEFYAKTEKEYRPVKKYLIEIKHPFVAQWQRDAIEKLGEQPIELVMHIDQKHMDEQLARLLKKNGYDSAVLLRPREPAIRELVIVDPMSILEELE